MDMEIPLSPPDNICNISFGTIRRGASYRKCQTCSSILSEDSYMKYITYRKSNNLDLTCVQCRGQWDGDKEPYIKINRDASDIIGTTNETMCIIKDNEVIFNNPIYGTWIYNIGIFTKNARWILKRHKGTYKYDDYIKIINTQPPFHIRAKHILWG